VPAMVLGLRQHALRPGLDLAPMACHSLRAGLLTSAASVDVPERVIAAQTDPWATAILYRYIREGSLFREDATGAVGR